MTAQPQLLIVEDDAAIQDSLVLALEDTGYQVEVAPNGAAALTALRTFQPALILLDICMPLMDGLSFIEAYHLGPGPHVPIIVITASRSVDEFRQRLDVAAVIEKPFELDDLLTAIQLALAGTGSADR